MILCKIDAQLNRENFTEIFVKGVFALPTYREACERDSKEVTLSCGKPMEAGELHEEAASSP